MSVRFLIVALATICSYSQSAAQSDALLRKFKENYLSKEEELYKRYVYNKRVSFRRIMGDGQLKLTVTTISSESNSRSTTVFPDGSEEHEFYSKDNGYLIRKKQNKNVIERQLGSSLFEIGFPYTQFQRISKQLLPLTFYELTDASTLGDCIRLSEVDVQGIPQFKFTDATEVQFRGRSSIALSGVNFAGKTGTVYYDSDRLIYLGFANTKEKVEGYVVYDDVTLEKMPLPKQLELWKVDAAGKKVLQYKDVVDKYEDYSASLDEFDIDKQFGLKPLPPKVKLRTNLPTFSKKSSILGYWLYGGAAFFAIISAVIIIYLKRSSRK